MKRPAVFIDRDGTINEQLGYINHESRFVIFPFVAEAVKLLNDSGFLAIVVALAEATIRRHWSLNFMIA